MAQEHSSHLMISRASMLLTGYTASASSILAGRLYVLEQLGDATSGVHACRAPVMCPLLACMRAVQSVRADLCIISNNLGKDAGLPRFFEWQLHLLMPLAAGPRVEAVAADAADQLSSPRRSLRQHGVVLRLAWYLNIRHMTLRSERFPALTMLIVLLALPGRFFFFARLLGYPAQSTGQMSSPWNP